jgi:hypothetical protein
MTPEQVRAKEKIIAAYRSIISGIEALKQNAVILVPGDKTLLHDLDRIEEFQEGCHERINTLQAIPDTAEIFVLGPPERVNFNADPPTREILGGPELMILVQGKSKETSKLPPEGPGIED